MLYERVDDLYAVELRLGEDVVERVDEVYFDLLGEVLERLIDDGRWRQIQVEILRNGARAQRQELSA